MSANWKFGLQRLQDPILVIRDSVRQEYHHGLIDIDGELLPTFTGAVPGIYAAGGKLLDQIVVPLPAGRCHVHYFFEYYGFHYQDGGPDRRGLDALQEHFHNLHSLLAKIPVRVLPRIEIPPLNNGLEENIVRWAYVLHWLARLPENKVFHSELEFAYSEDDLVAGKNFKPWGEFSSLPDFDPVAFLTPTAPPTREAVEEWKQLHREAGRQFPAVFASSLTKPLFYASVNAIDLLLRRQDAFELEKNDAKPRPDARPGRLGGDLSDREALVLSVLMKHHGCYTDKPVFASLKQEELAARTVTQKRPKGISQSTVSRALGDLLERGVPKYYPHLDAARRYELLCEDRLIVQVLEHIDNPRRWSEFGSTGLDRFGVEDERLAKVLERIDNPVCWSESDSTDLDKFEDRGF